jgi:UDPglucose 6-dehydrogenase
MKIAVIGCGYVGLVSAVCLASRGHAVAGVDVDAAVVDRLNAGKPHIHEQGLEALLKQTVGEGRFRATADLASALSGAELVFIAVGTPTHEGKIDLAQVRQASRAIGAWLKGNDAFLGVIVKSTVIPGTTDTVVRAEIELASGKKTGAGFGLGMNPEFLREGNAVGDFLAPDRIVLGHEDARTLGLLERLYDSFACDKLRVNSRTAEMMKYANNALLAVQISTANELANLAQAAGGIDAMAVMRAVHLDQRWNPLRDGKRTAPGILSYLSPGPGFGGSCFPKDVQALLAEGQRHGLTMAMMDAVLAVNRNQPAIVVDALERNLGGLAGRNVLVLGLAFKPGTDDVRESASIRIVELLLDRKSRVSVHDPLATDNFLRTLGPHSKKVVRIDDWARAAAESPIIIVATTWPDYRALASLDLRGKTILDARRMFDPAAFSGATYLGVGLASDRLT